MAGKALALTVFMGVLACADVLAKQAPARGGAPPPGQASPASGQGVPAPSPGGQGAGSQGDPDPGVHFVVLIDNPSVRVLQVTLQPGAARRIHIHNDVTFHMMIPITGSLELIMGSTTAPSGEETVTAVPGQAYYLVKGQPHRFANKTTTAVQVIEVFVKPGEGPPPWPVPFVPPAETATPPAP